MIKQAINYKVCSLDVWANEEGYDINNWFNCGEISIPEDATHKDIINIMIEEGYLKPLAVDKVIIESDWNNEIRILDLNDMPLFDLIEIA